MNLLLICQEKCNSCMLTSATAPKGSFALWNSEESPEGSRTTLFLLTSFYIAPVKLRLQSCRWGGQVFDWFQAELIKSKTSAQLDYSVMTFHKAQTYLPSWKKSPLKQLESILEVLFAFWTVKVQGIFTASQNIQSDPIGPTATDQSVSHN